MYNSNNNNYNQSNYNVNNNTNTYNHSIDEIDEGPNNQQPPPINLNKPTDNIYTFNQNHNNNNYNNSNNNKNTYNNNNYSLNYNQDTNNLPPPPINLDKPTDNKFNSNYNNSDKNKYDYLPLPPAQQEEKFIINNNVNNNNQPIISSYDYLPPLEEKWIIKNDCQNYESPTNTNATSTTTSTTTTTSNNNEYDEYKSKLFYTIWKNKLIRKIIMFHLKKYNQSCYTPKEFISLKSYYESNINTYMDSLVLNNAFENGNSIEEFINSLPENITSLELKSKLPYKIDLEQLSLPTTLTHLNLGPHHLSIPPHKENYEQLSVFKNLKSIKIPANIVSFKNIKFPSLIGLTSIDMGCYNKKIPAGAIPNTCTKLRLGRAFIREIKPGMLPDSIKELVLSSDYEHSHAAFPKNLKVLMFERCSQNVNPSVLQSIPNSVTLLKLYCTFSEPIKSFSNQLPSNLKKLILIGKVESNCFKPSLFKIGSSGIPQLTKLDLSESGFVQKLNVDHLPQSLRTLKVSKTTTLEGGESSKKGFPGSLERLQCDTDSIIRINFQNPSNLQHLAILCNSPIGPELFDKFVNLKSIKFYYDHLFLPIDHFIIPRFPKSILNIEIINLTKGTSLCDPFNIQESSKLRSLHLEKSYTACFLEKSNDSDSPSPFPSNLQLLDLDFPDSSFRKIYPINGLPSSLKVLIIRGVVPDIVELPSSLEYLWIQDKNTMTSNTLKNIQDLESDTLSIKTFDYSNYQNIYSKSKKFIHLYNYNDNIQMFLNNNSYNNNNSKTNKSKK